MKIKKITACILASIMALSTALTASASGTGAGSSAGQGNIGNTGSTNDKGNGTWSVTANTGFRLTIVDGSGAPVSKILGVDNAVSFDVVNDGIREAGEFWSACATAPNQGKDAYVTTWRTMSQFMSYIGESEHGPLYWMNTANEPLGDSIREFILKGTSSTGSGGSSGSLGDLGAAVSKAANIALMESFLKTLDEEMKHANEADNIKEAQAVVDKVSSLRAPFASALKGAYPTDGKAQWLKINDWQKRINPILRILSKNFPDLYQITRNESYVGGVAEFGYRFEEFPLVWEAYKKQQAGKVAFNLNPLDWFSLTAYAATSNPPSTGSVAKEGKTAVITDKSVLARIIDMTIDGVYVFQLEGTVTKKADAEAGKGLAPSQVFIEKGYNLLLEATIQGQPQEYKGDWTNYKSLVYGTAHNWAQFLQTPGWKKVYSGDSAGNQTKYINQYITNGLVTLTDWIGLFGNVVLRAPTHGGKYPNSEMISRFNTGYGCHLYTGVDLLGLTSQIDTSNPPPSTGESFVLNRFFREKKKDGSYTYTRFDTHSYSLTEAAIPVLINANAENAALVEWGTSEVEKFIPDVSKNPSEYTWEAVKTKNTGVEKGTATKTLEMKKDSKIQTINILYEIGSNTQVVKVYEDSDGNTEKVTPPTPVTGTEYTVPDESEYVYTENKTSPNPPKTVTSWENSEGSGGTGSSIKITDEIKTVYIKYTKQNADTKTLELFSNELSYTYDLRDLLQDRKVLSVYDSVPASPGTKPSCSGHTRTTGTPPNESTESYSCSVRTHYLPDGHWTVKVDSGFDYSLGGSNAGGNTGSSGTGGAGGAATISTLP